jgi:MoxR-like ATPase
VIGKSTAQALDGWHPELRQVADAIASAIVGKQDVIRLLLTALVAGGHCLIEDVPGVGKTALVRATAKAVGCEFRRIQFTPDLLPSDVTGVSVYNQKTGEFEFRPGPVFAQVVLADEVNRTSPKTQSALLEAMEEGSVTVDGRTYRLPSPFFVLATENPIEFEGTFPLPEAQLDRFLIKIRMGYPSLADELEILARRGAAPALEAMVPVACPEDVVRWQREAAGVYVAEGVSEYMVRIVQGTRSHPAVALGGSPRATLALHHAAQAFAYVAGRDYVVPDDVRHLAAYVLEHRILLTAEARMAGLREVQVIQEIVSKVPVPMQQPAGRGR